MSGCFIRLSRARTDDEFCDPCQRQRAWTLVDDKNVADGDQVGPIGHLAVILGSVKWFTLALCLERVLSETQGDVGPSGRRLLLDFLAYPSPAHIQVRRMVSACVTARVLYRTDIVQLLLPDARLLLNPTPHLDLFHDDGEDDGKCCDRSSAGL